MLNVQVFPMHPSVLIPPVLACGLSFGLCRAMVALGPKLGLMDQPDERRVHLSPVPRAGGIAVWLAFVALAYLIPLGNGLLGGGRWGNVQLLHSFVCASAVLVAVGVADDRRELKPWWKLLGQVVAAVCFFSLQRHGHGILLGWHVPVWVDMAFFVAWAVLLVNAYNLIDGLDGLCGGLALISIVCLAVMAGVTGRVHETVLLATMGGALVAFLYFNRHPARLFLGDAGSMMLGFFIATFATEAVGRKAVVGVFLLPIALAGIPLLDVLLAIWRRSTRNVMSGWLGQGKVKVFGADKDHIHHRFLQAGMTQRRTARFMHIAAILVTVLAFLPLVFDQRVLGITVVGLLVLAFNGVRQFARIEMVQSGSFIHMAVKRPEASRRLRLVLFFSDTVVIALAAWVAMLVETNVWYRGHGAPQVWLFVLLFVAVGSLALRGANIYRRMWSRARFRDRMVVTIWLAGAGLAVTTCFQLSLGDVAWSAVRCGLIATGLAIAGVLLPRTLPELMREMGVDANHRRFGPKERGKENRHVVVYGAGDLGNLFLDYLKTSTPESLDGVRVVGFIDDTAELKGRILRGFPVLGTLEALERLAADHDLFGVVVAINEPDPQRIADLESRAARLGLVLYWWKAGMGREK